MNFKHTSRRKSLIAGLGLVSANLDYGNSSLKNGEDPPDWIGIGARKV